jgi:hypothetical protein
MTSMMNSMYKTVKSMVIAGLLVSLSVQLSLAGQQQQEVEQQKKVDSESIFTLKNLLIAGVITAGVAAVGVAAWCYFSPNNDHGSDTGNNYPFVESCKKTVEDAGEFSKIFVQNTHGNLTIKENTTSKNVVINIEKKAAKEEDLKKLNVMTEKKFGTNEKTPNTLFVTSIWDTNVVQNACINYKIEVPKKVDIGFEISFGIIDIKGAGNIKGKLQDGNTSIQNVQDVTCEFGKTVIKTGGWLILKGNWDI